MWKISWLHNTGLKSINEHSKIKESFIFLLNWARSTQKCRNFAKATQIIITIHICLVTYCITSTGFLPTCGFSFYRKQVPKGTNNLKKQLTQQSQRNASDINSNFHTFINIMFCKKNANWCIIFKHAILGIKNKKVHGNYNIHEYLRGMNIQQAPTWIRISKILKYCLTPDKCLKYVQHGHINIFYSI